MKNLEKIIEENQDILLQSNLYNIWDVSNRRRWNLSFTGTLEDCEKEFSAMGYDEVNDRIYPNAIKDRWENEVELIGYVTFENDVTLSYAIEEEEEEEGAEEAN